MVRTEPVQPAAISQSVVELHTKTTYWRDEGNNCLPGVDDVPEHSRRALRTPRVCARSGERQSGMRPWELMKSCGRNMPDGLFKSKMREIHDPTQEGGTDDVDGIVRDVPLT
jgi:hypothetical protein